MRLLVTGGLGFIGSNFCRLILTEDKQIEVVNVDKVGVGANPENLRDLENENRYTFVKGDICNSQLLSKVIKQVDAVVNIAAETHVDRSISEPYSFLESNTLGTYTILESLRKYNDRAKFVQVSTDEVYGDILEGAFKESDEVKPSNPYSASKAAADMFVRAYHKTYDLKTFITRCTNNFGQYQFPEKLIPKTIIRAVQDLPIPVYGSGKNVREWIYAIDHCEAIISVLEKGKPGEVYNVSSGNELSNLELVKKILKMLHKSDKLITFVEDRPGHDVRYCLDSSKIQKELGWNTKFSFDKALKLTVEWYASNEKWWKPLATDKVLNATPWKTRDQI